MTKEKIVRKRLGRLIPRLRFWGWRNLTPTGSFYREAEFGGDMYYPAFYQFPEITGRIARDPSKVLVCSTNADSEMAMAAADEAARRQGIDRPEFVFCRLIENFWPEFFGCQNFMNPLAKRRIPALLVTSGEMRHYMPGGTGMYVDGAGEWLEQVAAKYEVAFVLAQPAAQAC